MIRVLIVDDHAIVRKGLAQALSETVDLVAAGEADNAAHAADQVRTGDWDVVLMDVSMPGRSGVDLLKQIKQEKPALPVLMLSMYPEDQYAVQLLKLGASGYLTKDSSPEELVTAIRTVAAGRRYIRASVAELLVEEMTRAGAEPHETLSQREDQIFRLLASGQPVSQIAEGLFLSVKTVSTYRTRVLEKMGLKNNAELTLYAIKHGLID
ncbi:MAG: response regulator transcription factor [Betaproteobacteria bacterium]|nr:response regulator transcription factor [Betaproteobacteria bacterium]